MILLITIMVIAGAILIMCSSNFDDEKIMKIAGIILIFLGGMLINSSTPSPLDVYRGKTTLEITYKDSIPIDSIVVFKEYD